MKFNNDLMSKHWLILALSGAVMVLAGCANRDVAPYYPGSGGGVLGSSMSQEQQSRLRADSPPTYVRIDQSQPLTVADIRVLTRIGVSDDIIISQIQISHTVYHLTASEVIGMRSAGVSERVVNFMINTPSSVGVMATSPDLSAIIIQQAPPPPVMDVRTDSPGAGYVWVQGEWVWNGYSWFWVAGYWTYPPYLHAAWVPGYTWHDFNGWHYRRGFWR
jgi:hypothetical protein